jgi:hypothetical protein
VTAAMEATAEMAVAKVFQHERCRRNEGKKMISKGILCLIVGSGLPLLTFGRNTPRVASVPNDPLELAAGQIQAASTPEGRIAVLQLLDRARNNYALRSGGQGYDLKINFAVDSLGQTDYDGVWEMEDLFVPGQGLHWTAKTASGYTVTGIASNGELYGEGAANAIPLRLQEARGILLHPLPSASYVSRESIRTSAATFRGALVTCILLSSSRNAATPALGRGWEESEECIDTQSGRLLLHSEVPGRYAVYDYSSAPQLRGHTLPRTVSITEAGRVVSRISVVKLEEISAADPSLFVPTADMKARGPAIEMTAATKISRIHGPRPFTSAMTVRPVCVFGMVTATGQLLEAHSLQPSDPNSQAAVEDAKRIDFSPGTPAGARPRQHFVFVVEKFVSRP